MSWNINGIKSCWQKGMPDWLASASPDIVCLQETRGFKKNGPPDLADHGYHAVSHDAEKAGYSGVAILSKTQPDTVVYGLDDEALDSEGRTVTAFWGSLAVTSSYFPNSRHDHSRLDYKLQYCEAIHAYQNDLLSKGHIPILLGDYNIAHQAIDLARPKENENNPGYLPQERAFMTTFISDGYLDTFRLFNQDPGHYSWWSYRGGARKRNVGWRIDYACMHESHRHLISDAEIHPDILGSDHCPVSVTVNLPLASPS